MQESVSLIKEFLNQTQGGRSEDVLLEFGRRKKRNSPGKPSGTSQQLLKEREKKARASSQGQQWSSVNSSMVILGGWVKGTVRASRTCKQVCMHRRFKDKNEERKRGKEKPGF